ncbi:hypothetical protein A2982_00940 [candidate division WWE3 bacterium RIFCSPLOWO2_01_FULL_39_13]|uniref:Uncharacterized protein n=1 Tax=candidate division WWE3 bacterium RIFCSPLOWO2_01_FULL_39_13 TaxID=1802624 RepID=A0A1F4V5E2_UNCKA|nr:MAG: hypothetical protein A2982_00940 [candidate division WWE3 bacterium RIFCSPLOWO2_01_FULL_39_13]
MVIYMGWDVKPGIDILLWEIYLDYKMSNINYFELEPGYPSIPAYFSPIDLEQPYPYTVVKVEGEEDDVIWRIPIPSDIYDRLDELPVTMQELLRFDPLDVGVIDFVRRFPSAFKNFCSSIDGIPNFVPELSWEFLNYKFTQAAVLLGIGMENLTDGKRINISSTIKKMRMAKKIVRVSTRSGFNDPKDFAVVFQGALNKAKQSGSLFAMYWRIISTESTEDGQISAVLQRDAWFANERIFVLTEEYIKSRGADTTSLEMIEYIGGTFGYW